ncbi:MAG: hypothetical protein K0S51_1163 [Bacillales bacterium]|jgi:hypothetical protein|nr:hypothetical protein [Bacillales bacterium]
MIELIRSIEPLKFVFFYLPFIIGIITMVISLFTNKLLPSMLVPLPVDFSLQYICWGNDVLSGYPMWIPFYIGITCTSYLIAQRFKKFISF